MPDLSVREYDNQQSSEVAIGNVLIGSNHPIAIQSMTTIQASDTLNTVQQIICLADAGCDIVRLAVRNVKEARNLKNIKNGLLKKGYDIPVVADVHFNPELAEIAAQYVDKVRINPGNFTGSQQIKAGYTEKEYLTELKKAEQKLLPLLQICKKHHTAIRIGVNHGSLSNRILVKYGNTPKGMVESVMEFIHICQQNRFERLTLSLKASDVRIMVEANKLLVNRMKKESVYYPLHLGVTEAGAGVDGRIKSAAGIGHLLMLGIGDTVRVSLTEDPIEEIPVARKLVELYGKKEPPEIHIENIILKEKDKLNQTNSIRPPFVISEGISAVADFSLERHEVLYKGKIITEYEKAEFPEAGQTEQPSFIKLDYSTEWKTVCLRAAAEFSFLKDIYPVKGICIHIQNTSADDNAKLALDILQATGLRYSKAEFIACPSCGRTNFNIQEHFEKVRAETSHLKGLKVAIMGCVVNGPGEMAGADYGYVGSGNGKINLYRNSQLVQKNLDEKNAIAALIELIKKNGEWQEV